ncbi:MAG: helix-turn-helix domain-containing protein [Planctomycetota bacterium]|jgi:transcriptional regulator with XRE-family HTH domain|nr:helix-turn-helix domain-containing protein [Planctomycetota bacterium]
MAKDIKAEFGRLMRLARDSKGMSRATLALRLGISPKTIQSWEMGRTFIERLDLIPQLEAELECSLSSLIAKATGATPSSGGDPRAETEAAIAEHHMGSASQQKLLTRPGPLSPKFMISVLSTGEDLDPEKLEGDWATVPLLRPAAVLNPVFSIQPKDIIRHVIIPREWVPRAGVLVAVRMSDSAMMPMIPLGATVIIDVRPLPMDRVLTKIAAIEFVGKGLRIRRVVKDMAGDRYFGASVTEHGRAQMQIRENKGDRILGEAIGTLAPF